MLIIHRDIEGEHNTEDDTCWCEPLLIEEDTLLTTEQIKELSDIKDLKQ
jgi:hypothetical protein